MKALFKAKFGEDVDDEGDEGGGQVVQKHGISCLASRALSLRSQSLEEIEGLCVDIADVIEKLERVD